VERHTVSIATLALICPTQLMIATATAVTSVCQETPSTNSYHSPHGGFSISILTHASANTLVHTHRRGRAPHGAAEHRPAQHLTAFKATFHLTGQVLHSFLISAAPACLHLFSEQLVCKRQKS